ncbi:hypothetical protein [Flocculibacter collagenilyticus]|uniref:hypothetical protein n=1 Tax=Flocculibacter collagenilyticus TaxID=2744479 RepID=UPI0018F630E5|nr:hypothetical protein [Flocculibacter collagenilyticus]
MLLSNSKKALTATTLYLAISSAGFNAPCFAADLLDNISVDLATTGRYYFNAEDKNQTVNNQFSKGIKAEAKFSHKFEHAKFNSQVFANWNDADEARRYIDIRKANLYFRKNDFTFGAGVDTFFWGVSESINVVNVMNQSDLMESLDGKVKLGQTFVSVSNRFSNGDISFYYLPEFRAITFPERPSYGLPIADHDQYEDDKKDGGFAARGLFYYDQFEFAVSYFKGTRRSPILMRQSPSSPLLTPYYLQTENMMFDGVYLSEDFTLKLEAKAGKELNNGFTTANLGIEYPSYLFADYIEEVTFIAEYVFDDRKLTAETHGQNDLFIGAKFDFGDTNQGRVRFLYSYDFDYSGQYAELSYQYRLNDYVRVKAKVMKVLTAEPTDQRLYALTGEEFAKFSLHYAF